MQSACHWPTNLDIYFTYFKSNSYADPADLKSTLKVTDDGDDIDDDSGRVSPPYGVVQPPELPQRSDLDLKRPTTTTINPNQSTGLFCCTATKAVRRTYIDWTLYYQVQCFFW